jgi:hypothetical protein
MTYRDDRDARIARLEAENADLRTRNEVQSKEIDDLMARLKLKHDPDEQARHVALAAHELYVTEALARGRRLGADTVGGAIRLIMLLLLLSTTVPGVILTWLLR